MDRRFEDTSSAPLADQLVEVVTDALNAGAPMADVSFELLGGFSDEAKQELLEAASLVSSDFRVDRVTCARANNYMRVFIVFWPDSAERHLWADSTGVGFPHPMPNRTWQLMRAPFRPNMN